MNPIGKARQDRAVRARLAAALRAAVLALACLLPGLARAEIWGYVDEAGTAHFATERLDERYQLFARTGQAFTSESLAPGTADAGGLESHRLFARVVANPNIEKYAPLIEQAAREQALDPQLVKAVIAVESAFEPRAVSPKGALGLMQVIPETAARYGVVADRKRSVEQKLFDPATNIRTGVRYLRDLMRLFSDDLELTLAAYNAGEGAVQRYRKVPPYAETREYVKLVQQFYAFYKPQAVAAAPHHRVRMVIPGARRNMPE